MSETRSPQQLLNMTSIKHPLNEQVSKIVTKLFRIWKTLMKYLINCTMNCVFSNNPKNNVFLHWLCFLLAERMINMGYSRKEIEESLIKNKYDEITATYLLLGRRTSEVYDPCPSISNYCDGYVENLKFYQLNSTVTAL